MMASTKLLRDCSSETRSLSVASSSEERESSAPPTTDSEYSEEEKEYELDDLQILKTIDIYEFSEIITIDETWHMCSKGVFMIVIITKISSLACSHHPGEFPDFV
ncbi:hypothetical protein EVAR_32549_1 [Eumeta japonica]|uniref:Uncharacterized protein n=1 Tax=Eumeta variegata TaxID=151549 RepID=A0A4C1VPM6_EUMVA|nr:hypothetical protein EVAR_32549_1 [Eumeta japonica]